MKNNGRLGLGLRLGLFYFILNSPPLTRNVTCSRLYLNRKNMRGKCQMNNLLLGISHTIQNTRGTDYKVFLLYICSDDKISPWNLIHANGFKTDVTK